MWIYNSLTKAKEEYDPKGEVNMYVCGPTVYDYLHVGNFRGAIFFNLVRNVLEAKGHKVNYVYNYTDVDDKILNKAKELNQHPLSVSEFFIKEFEDDYKKLGLRPHTQNPKVSQYIPEMIKYVQEIMDKDLAYERNGSVYIRRHKMGDVGLLSGRDINDGLNSDKNLLEDKEHPSDFALWKKESPGDLLSWDSPWGKGRPGWHLECSVMIHEIFKGQTLDIHGGGIDLLFPHHENECYQCKAHGESTLSKFWIHNNMLNVDGQKMSKSLGNVITGRSFIESHSGELLKFMVVFHQYRSVIDFGQESIKTYRSQLARFYQAMKKAQGKGVPTDGFKDLFDKVMETLEDDFNTPETLGVIYEAMNRFYKNEKEGANFLLFMNNVGQVIGLFNESINEYSYYLDTQDLANLGIEESFILAKIQERHFLRQDKKYDQADKVRSDLVQKGINLLDSKTGTSWEVIRSSNKND